MTSKTRVEWGTVCAHWPDTGHKVHLRARKDESKARQEVIDSNDLAEKLTAPGNRHWFTDEAPFRVVSRTVLDWAVVEDEVET